MTAGWSKPALEKYLGPDEKAWREYDACALIDDGHRFPELPDGHAADRPVQGHGRAAARRGVEKAPERGLQRRPPRCPEPPAADAAGLGAHRENSAFVPVAVIDRKAPDWISPHRFPPA